MDRKGIFEYAEKKYRSMPEYLWEKSPDSAVLRHRDNRKWYAVVMNVAKEKLGLDGAGRVDVLDMKCDPEMIGALRSTDGILPGYHMNKNSWISVLLDGSVEKELICNLLDISYGLTETKKKR